MTLVVAAICVSLYLNSREIKKSASMVTALKSQVQTRQQEYDKVATEASQLQTSFSQEAIIRNQLLMQKPGEYIVQMPDLPAETVETPVLAPTLTPWQQWQQLLLSH